MQVFFLEISLWQDFLYERVMVYYRRACINSQQLYQKQMQRLCRHP